MDSDSLAVGVLAGVVGVVVPAACCFVKHLDGHLAVALVDCKGKMPLSVFLVNYDTAASVN